MSRRRRARPLCAFLLFEKPRDVLRLIEGGVKIDSVNVGGMRFENDREQVTKSVSVTADDIAAFKALQALGIRQELRQLPSDSAVDFMTKLK